MHRNHMRFSRVSVVLLLLLLGAHSPASAAEHSDITSFAAAEEAVSHGGGGSEVGSAPAGSFGVSTTCTVWWDYWAEYYKPSASTIAYEWADSEIWSNGCAMASMSARSYVTHHCTVSTHSASDVDSGTNTYGPLFARAYQQVQGFTFGDYCAYGTSVRFRHELRWRFPSTFGGASGSRCYELVYSVGAPNFGPHQQVPC